MYGWMGWFDAGHVDRLGDEVVTTEFFHAVVPLWPRGSSQYVYRDRDAGLVYLEIPRHARSVVLGYLRIPSWLATTMCAAGGVMTRTWSLLAVALVLAAIAAGLTFVAGRLDPIERERRLLLQRITGLGVPPEWCSRSSRDLTRDRVAEQWFEAHGVDWNDAIRQGRGDEMLVAIAEYDGSPKLLARARQNLLELEGN
mgnify:CR=1 FL=1